MQRDVPPIVSVVGRKNSGKTTLLVALAAELKRRGLRVASVKHSHHDFEIDHRGKDSWRHFHEGEVEAVLVASPHRVALVFREEAADRDPRALIQRHFGGLGYDLVLVEAFRHVAFPRIEVFRVAAHPDPIYCRHDASGATYVAIVTDSPERLDTPSCPIVVLDDAGAYVAATADAVLGWLAREQR